MTIRHLLSTTISITVLAASLAFGRLHTALFGAVHLQAQTSVAGAPGLAFEVASVKPNKSGSPGMQFGMQPGGRFTVTNVPLKEIVRVAYGVQGSQLVGGPDWASTERFDIVAKAAGDFPPSPPGGPPGPQMQMLQTLLADRFALKVHKESREMPIYALMTARSDAKPGPGLRPAAVDCAATMAAARARGGPPPLPPGPGQPMTCGMRIGMGSMAAGSMGMAQLAASLSQMVGRVVLDRTGLTQNFDFELRWTPDQMPARAPGTPPDQPVLFNGAAIDPNGPSIFTALQEQLGLKLESTKGQIDVLIIDSAERPKED